MTIGQTARKHVTVADGFQLLQAILAHDVIERSEVGVQLLDDLLSRQCQNGQGKAHKVSEADGGVFKVHRRAGALFQVHRDSFRQDVEQQAMRRLPLLAQLIDQDGALVEPGILDRHGSLQREPFQEVELIEVQRSIRTFDHHQLGEKHACLVIQRNAANVLRLIRVNYLPGFAVTACVLLLQFRRYVSVGLLVVGKKGARELQFIDNDAQGGPNNLVKFGGRVDQATGLEQRLQADDLLLRVQQFVQFTRLIEFPYEVAHTTLRSLTESYCAASRLGPCCSVWRRC